MHDATTGAAVLLGLGPVPDKGAVRHAFRNAVRQGRPDLGGMSGEQLARLISARDALLAVAPPAPTATPVFSSAFSSVSYDRAGRLHPRSFDAAARPPTGRLVDVYA